MKIKYYLTKDEEQQFELRENNVFYLDSILGVPVTDEQKAQILKDGYFEYDLVEDF